jgi:hypothetical protein
MQSQGQFELQCGVHHGLDQVHPPMPLPGLRIRRSSISVRGTSNAATSPTSVSDDLGSDAHFCYAWRVIGTCVDNDRCPHAATHTQALRLTSACCSPLGERLALVISPTHVFFSKN